jgi:nitrous oxide reductase
MSEKRKRESRQSGRRKFLKGVLVGSGAAVVAVASGGAVAAPESKQAAVVEPKTQSQGYRVTPHILDYYKTAQL